MTTDIALIAHDQLTIVQAKRHVRTLRSTLHLTQQELADLLGVTNITICRWETGCTLPSPMAWKMLGLLQRYQHLRTP